MDIGAAIKKLRQERKLTLEGLADLAHTSKPNLSNLERNAQGFSPVILSSLAKALGVKVSEIFQLAERMEEPAGDGTEHGADETAELLAIFDALAPQRRQALLMFLKTWSGPVETWPGIFFRLSGPCIHLAALVKRDALPISYGRLLAHHISPS